MEQISGISSGFLALERPGVPMAVTSVAIYQSDEGGDNFPAVRQAFLNSIAKFPVFRQRLLKVPALIDHPYWIEDPDFDVDCHLRQLALPRPGNWQQFHLQLARLQATPMHRDRPLWQAFVIEGLNGLSGIPKNSFAIVLRAHRAIADARELNAMLLRMHDLEPVVPQADNSAFCLRDNPPLPGELLINAVRNHSRRLWQSRRLLPRAYARYARQRSEGADMPVLPALEQTRFNHRPSGYRVVNHLTLKHRDCEALRRLVPGSSLCDVMLALLGGTLRNYLMRKDELPSQGLVAGCPSDLPRDLHKRRKRRVPGLLRLNLHTDCASPLQRLRQLQLETSAARARDPEGTFALLNEASELLPPLLMTAGARSYLRLNPGRALACNTFIGGVRGSDVPVYFAGARLLRQFSLDPLFPGCALSHSVSRWGEEMIIGINACREALPDPEVYLSCLEEAWAELRACVEDSESGRGQAYAESA